MENVHDGLDVKNSFNLVLKDQNSRFSNQLFKTQFGVVINYINHVNFTF